MFMMTNLTFCLLAALSIGQIKAYCGSDVGSWNPAYFKSETNGYAGFLGSTALIGKPTIESAIGLNVDWGNPTGYFALFLWNSSQNGNHLALTMRIGKAWYPFKSREFFKRFDLYVVVRLRPPVSPGLAPVFLTISDEYRHVAPYPISERGPPHPLTAEKEREIERLKIATFARGMLKSLFHISAPIEHSNKDP